MIDMFGLIAAIASALATLFVAYAAWRGPKSAAELAERLRRDAENDSERRRQKFEIFAMLMQERSAIYTENAVRALNLIDAIFYDVHPVREAWAELFLKLNVPGGINFDNELRKLLTTIAQDLGIGKQFGQADASRVYIPNALAQERLVRDLERRQDLLRLQGGVSPSANTAAPSTPSPKAASGSNQTLGTRRLSTPLSTRSRLRRRTGLA